MYFNQFHKVDDIICKVWWDFGSLNNDNISFMQQIAATVLMLSSVGKNQFHKVADNINL